MIWLLIGTLGCVDYGVKERDEPPSAPSVAIQPATPTTVDDLVATITSDSVDPEGGDVSYTWEWYLDGTLQDDLATSTIPAERTAKGQTWEVVVTPTDGVTDGPTGSAGVEVANTPPTLSLDLPEEVGSTEDIVAVVETDDVDGDPVDVEWTWVRNGEATTVDSQTVAASETARGDTWELTATPTDDDGAGTPATATTTVANATPAVESAAVAPAEVYEESELSCVGSGWSDADGDPEAYTLRWLVDDVEVATSDALDGGAFDRGDRVACALTPTDGITSGDEVTSAAVEVQNTAPSLDGAAVSPEAPVEGSELSCEPTGWRDVDGDPEAYTVRWLVDGAEVATTETLDGDHFDRGDRISCALTPTDGLDVGAEVISTAVEVGNSAPAVDSAWIDPTEVYEDSVLSCNGSGWSDADGDAADYAVQWLVDDVEVATSDTLDGGSFDRGDRIACTLTPDDGFDTGAAVTSDDVTVSNTPPSLESAVIDPASATETTTLSCLGTGWTDADGDDEGWTTEWLVDGTVVATTDTLDGDGFDKGDTVRCRLTPDDGYDTGDAVTSDAVEVGNSAPVLDSAALSDSSPTESDLLTVVLGETSDPDDDDVELRYRWYVDDTLVSTETSIDGGDFDRGDPIYCTVIPWDGTDEGDPVTTDIAVAGNSPPQVLSVELTPGTAGTDDTLTALVSASDADGDDVSLDHVWTVDGETVAADESSLDGSLYFDKGQGVVVTVTPHDGSDAGSPLASDAVVIDNTPPAAPAVSISPADPVDDDELVCVVDEASLDADGDVIDYEMSWTVDGSPFADSTTTTWRGDTIAASDTAADEEWTCTVTPNDGDDVGATASASATICSGTVNALEVDAGAVANAPASSDWDLGDQLSVEYWARFHTADSDYNQMSVSTEHLDEWGWHCTFEALYPREEYARFMMDPAYSTRLDTRLEVILDPITDDEWHHFACQYDGATMRLFIDGELVGSQAHSDPVEYLDTQLYMLFRNRYYSTGTQDYTVREVRVGNQAIYDRDFTPEWNLEPTTGTVALFHMDEGSGSVLYDEVGGHEATFINATWTTAEACR